MAPSQSAPQQEIHLAQGTIRYRDTGEGKPLVFVHGLLVDGTLWVTRGTSRGWGSDGDAAVAGASVWP